MFMELWVGFVTVKYTFADKLSVENTDGLKSRISGMKLKIKFIETNFWLVFWNLRLISRKH